MVKPFSQIFQAVCDLEEEKNQYISKVSPGLGLAGGAALGITCVEFCSVCYRDWFSCA